MADTALSAELEQIAQNVAYRNGKYSGFFYGKQQV